MIGPVWSIERPVTSLSFHRPADVAAGSLAPLRTLTFPFFSDGTLRFDPHERVALMSTGQLRRELAFVELSSGRRSDLPEELNKIGSSGGASMQWLPDGRFLTIGIYETIIAGPRGEQTRRLPTLPPGQYGTVSPSGRHVALWSYTANTAAIVDLETGAVRSLGGGYSQCSVYVNAAVQWSPDSRTLAIGYCTAHAAGTPRTAFIDAASGRVVGGLDGWVISFWLSDGRMLARSWDAGDTYRGRSPLSTIRVLDARLQTLHSIESPSPADVSPDGRWLVDRGLDPNKPTSRLIDLSTGQIHAFLDHGYPRWTPSGLLAVIR